MRHCGLLFLLLHSYLCVCTTFSMHAKQQQQQKCLNIVRTCSFRHVNRPRKLFLHIRQQWSRAGRSIEPCFVLQSSLCNASKVMFLLWKTDIYISIALDIGLSFRWYRQKRIQDYHEWPMEWQVFLFVCRIKIGRKWTKRSRRAGCQPWRAREEPR